jgi:hypothetical protein
VHSPPQLSRQTIFPAALAILVLATFSVPLVAQLPSPSRAPRGNTWLPPGEIGQRQLMRSPTLPAYFQPVEFQLPDSVRIAPAMDGRFLAPQAGPVKAGLLIGSVYRFRVTGIPNHIGEEVYPSVELLDRLYPPPGRATDFPIPITLSVSELEKALAGRFITRVIYLEDPRKAFPAAQHPTRQLTYDVPSHTDPLDFAQQLGRPVAILRLGSRMPGRDRVSGRFLFATPPWQPLSSNNEAPADAVQRQPAIPRIRIARPAGPPFR